MSLGIMLHTLTALDEIPDRRPRDPDEVETESRCAKEGGTCPPFCSPALGGCGADDVYDDE